jgi:hypothetical protein
MQFCVQLFGNGIHDKCMLSRTLAAVKPDTALDFSCLHHYEAICGLLFSRVDGLRQLGGGAPCFSIAIENCGFAGLVASIKALWNRFSEGGEEKAKV